MKRLIVYLFKRWLRSVFKDEIELALTSGLGKGYKLGWEMRGQDIRNKGYVIGVNLKQDIEEIMQKAGF